MSINIISSKRLHRDSNLELLRFISIFFVVITHCGLLALPNYDFSSTPRNIFLFSLEFLTNICVNCFILISGFYSIKASVRSFISFLFQVTFIPLLVYIILSLSGVVTVSVHSYLHAFDISSYWFVVSYIGLYLLSPALNVYVNSLSRQQFSRVLLFATIIYLILGWPYDRIGTDFGFSVISFVYLYLVGRYVSLHPVRWTSFSKARYALIYFAASAFGIIIAILALHFGISFEKINRLYSYNSPIIIISTLAFFLFFKNLKFHSRFINIIATFSFSIYLIHGHPVLINIYLDKLRLIWDTAPLSSYILIGIVACPIIFTIAAAVIDSVRILAWSAISSIYSRLSHRHSSDRA